MNTTMYNCLPKLVRAGLKSKLILAEKESSSLLIQHHKRKRNAP